MRPTAKLLTSVVMEAATRGDRTLVYDLVREMKALGYDPLVGTYVALIKFYGEVRTDLTEDAAAEQIPADGCRHPPRCRPPALTSPAGEIVHANVR